MLATVVGALAATVEDVVIIGAGPNGLRLMSCLQNHGVSHTTFERYEIGSTVARWYEGSLTHSPRDTLTIGGVTPVECSSCLDEIFQDDFATVYANGGKPAKCELDHGHRNHCGRDDYMRYMKRAVAELKLRVVTGSRVSKVRRQSDGLLEVMTEDSTGTTKSTLARSVVLASGASSPQRMLTLESQDFASRVSYGLALPDIYARKAVVVIGAGPSGLESAIRSVNYGASHVSLVVRAAVNASRDQGMKYAFGLASSLPQHVNPYLGPAFQRLRRFLEEGRLSVHYPSQVTRLTKAHAHLSTGEKVPADHVIAAVGYTSDEALLQAMRFPNGRLNKATGETSISGVFNVGVSKVSPWKESQGAPKGVAKSLGTNIEDSENEVKLVCKELVRRHAQKRRLLNQTA